MKVKQRKGQSALEFLTTYGWAFLVILIMIGALGYFGILNPARYLPERCNVNTEFSCDEFALERGGSKDLRVRFYLSNALGQAIDVEPGSLDLDSDVFTGILNESSNNPPDIECNIGGEAWDSTDVATVSADESFLVDCKLTTDAAIEVNLPNEGSKLKVGYTLTYTPQGKELSKPIAGEMFGTLQ
ncbi:MAG: hypothetical protein ACQER9_03985 [Nanobdellota archaeon]